MQEDLVMKESIPLKRQRRKKRMDGKQPRYEATLASDTANKYHIEIYNVIADTIVSSLERRFDRSATSTFYADLSPLHPRNFGEVPQGAMEEQHS